MHHVRIDLGGFRITIGCGPSFSETFLPREVTPYLERRSSLDEAATRQLTTIPVIMVFKCVCGTSGGGELAALLSSPPREALRCTARLMSWFAYGIYEAYTRPGRDMHAELPSPAHAPATRRSGPENKYRLGLTLTIAPEECLWSFFGRPVSTSEFRSWSSPHRTKPWLVPSCLCSGQCPAVCDFPRMPPSALALTVHDPNHLSASTATCSCYDLLLHFILSSVSFWEDDCPMAC
jgi:hypothetical protein